MNYLKMLEQNVNEAQYRAITHRAGAMLVLAGPGSGKTFTVTQRIKYLIEHHHVKPENILVITFTKAAATEMQERFVRLNEGRNYPVHFGTFHSIFFQILRHTYRFTAQNIIREGDKYRLLSQIISEIPDEIRSQSQIDDSSDTLQRILSEISAVKNNGITPQELKSVTVTQAEFEYIFQIYKQEMNHHKLIDFDDMVLLCRDLLVSRPETLKIWQERFQYILVDEFQDICPLQYEVVRLLAKPQDNLFIVGDDDQSIYGFRGSKPEIMLNFNKDYPEAKQVLLDVNYRSRKDIVDVAGKLISHNKARFDKKVRAQNEQLGGVKIYSFHSKLKQAENIALLIKQYMAQPGARYSDIAILYRTNNHTVYTADRLMKEGIPFSMKEKPKNIYDSTVAKDIIAYIRYALHEDNVEDFLRIMNKPVRYIKRMTVPRKPFRMQELIENNRAAGYVIQNILDFYDSLHFIKNLNPFSAVNFIRKGIGYEKYLKKQALEQGRDVSEDFEELDELMQLAKDFETIPEWLDQIQNYDAVMQEIMQQERRQKQADTDAVSMVTMHASKGLEWKVVVLPDVNEGVIPHKKAVTDSELEEERRMFYVAMTRAREYLFIFYLQEKEAGNLLPSRFLDEIMTPVP
ncbi:MAG: ATP-dependent helicase [Lachnospiraceae bacterium]|nr:ATP-dependent helicase [Lachnospiraceae bacterium]